MEHLLRVLALRHHQFLADDIPFSEVSLRSISGFKQWNDAYLIALAVKHRLKFCTLERKLGNMDASATPVLMLI